MTDDNAANERASEGGSGHSTPASRTDAASPEKVERLAQQFTAEGRPFARVTVVRREPPVSANVGDRAIVTPDGELFGWIGGAGCAQSVTVREATAAMEAGEPALIGLAPDPDTIDRPGIESFPMTCHSGGVLELFVEPVAPTTRLVVLGDTPISRSLARLAAELTYDVTVATASEVDAGAYEHADEVLVATDADAVAAIVDGAAAVVVASMGTIDEVGVEAAVRTEVPYVGLVASEARAGELYETVSDRTGLDPGAIEGAVTRPAGIDVGARTAEEIAVSILAELIAVRHGEVDGTGTSEQTEGTDDGEPDQETVVDPVCAMTVVVGEAAATVDDDGQTYHFCGQGCADAFMDDPDRFLDAMEAE